MNKFIQQLSSDEKIERHEFSLRLKKTSQKTYDKDFSDILNSELNFLILQLTNNNAK